MADSNAARWTEVDRALYASHIRKLNAPRPAQGPAGHGVSLAETLRDYRSTILRVARATARPGGMPAGKRRQLNDLASLQLDGSTGLHHPRHLDTADMVHDGPVLAIKVKNLKKLKGRQNPPSRKFLYGMLVDTLLSTTHDAFAGYYGRMYVLVDATREAWILVHLLAHELDRLIEPLILEGVHEVDLPRIISGYGRTWEEAKLVTRGSLRQDQIPLEDDLETKT